MPRRLLLAAVLLLLPACERPQAYGEPNSIIVGAPTELWTALGETVMAGLEPTIFTVRDERTFKVTHKDVADPDWTLLRQFRQVLVFGTADAPWMEEPIAAIRKKDASFGEQPGIGQTFDVWAKGQVINVMVLPAGAGPTEAAPLVDSLRALLDRQYREISTARMYASGHNDSLAVALATEHGFTIDLPSVYYWDSRDSTFIFRNDNPDPSRLIRQIAVTWRSPLPERLPTTEEAGAWRDEIVSASYMDLQMTELGTAEVRSGRLAGRDALEVRAIWANPPEDSWPRGGPVLFRAIACPEQDRLYAVDAWLFAPGEDKYQYMIQLETILDSFRCGVGPEDLLLPER